MGDAAAFSAADLDAPVGEYAKALAEKVDGFSIAPDRRRDHHAEPSSSTTSTAAAIRSPGSG